MVMRQLDHLCFHCMIANLYLDKISKSQACLHQDDGDRLIDARTKSA